MVGQKLFTTGDTLCAESDPILLEDIEFPEPVISMAIEPKTTADKEALLSALQDLVEEDPTFHTAINEETGQTIIQGMGELHLEIIKDRILREYKVHANAGKPMVAYRESVSAAGEVVTPLIAILEENIILPRCNCAQSQMAWVRAMRSL